MFLIDATDNSIYVTRGDACGFNFSAQKGEQAHTFDPGDIIRFSVCEKKRCDSVVLQKDFPVEAPTEVVGIFLTSEETKIGNIASKPVEYWYEVELIKGTEHQTMIGYDNDSPKKFFVLPEFGGAEL